MDPQDFVLSAYRNTLEVSLDSGYEFVFYSQIGKEDAPLTCLLRHDIDHELFNLKSMMDVEKDLGINATYFLMTRSTSYNVLCLEACRVVGRLLENGHQIGLHFMGEKCEHDSVDMMVEKIRSEANWLEREFGTTIQAMSFHQPSQTMLDAKIRVPGLVNTYNAAQMSSYFYVSDTNMIWRHEQPTEIFQRKLHHRLQLLFHPLWWSERPLDLAGKWRAVLDANRRTIIEHWRSRERTLLDGAAEDMDLMRNVY